MIAKSPTGSPILGTFERLTARAEINHNSFTRGDDGRLDFEWEGGSEVFWDDQRTVTRDGERVFLDENGAEWKESEIILTEEDDEEATEAA